MAKREIDFLVDPRGVLLGMWRRYKGTAHGLPKVSEKTVLLWQQAQLYRYVDWKLDQLIREHPGEPEPLLARASREIEEQQWEKLLTTSEALRRNFPAHVSGFRHACWALRRLKRLDEGEEIAKRTIRRFPLSYIGWEAYANCSTDRGDLPEAVRRWAAMRARFPDKGFGHTMHALALVKIGELEAADAILAAAVNAFPQDSTIRREHAASAERLGDWRMAAERWLDAAQQFEADPVFHARAVNSLVKIGDLQAAQEVLRNAEFMFPKSVDIQTARKTLGTALTEKDP